MLMNMKELLSVANEHNFAVPAFNIGTGQILNAVVECCEEKQAPVILAIHPNELEFQGDSFIEMCKDRANKSHVPMCIHLDHGATMEQVQRAIRCGFTSVMIDASSESFEDNIKITKEVIKVAHPLGVSVEAELGTIGDIKEDSGNREIGSKEIIFTKPEDAKKFVNASMKCDFDIDVFYNRVVIDAKSILGVMSLDLTQILTVEYTGEDAEYEAFLDTMEADNVTAA